MPAIIVDSREKLPYRFLGHRVLIRALSAGDYSLESMEGEVAIERKQLPELFACAGRERTRFKKELERLSKFSYAAIVVECSLKDLLMPPPYTKMNPKAVINSFIAWSVKYRVCVFFAGDRVHAQALTRRLLEKYWKYREV